MQRVWWRVLMFAAMTLAVIQPACSERAGGDDVGAVNAVTGRTRRSDAPRRDLSPVGLDGSIEKFSQRLDPGEDELVATFVQTLGTMAGRIAVGEDVERAATRRRTDALREAFRSYVAQRFVRIDERYRVREARQDLRRALVERDRVWQEALRSLTTLLNAVSQRLRDHTPIDQRLARFLRRPSSPEAIQTTILVRDDQASEPADDASKVFLTTTRLGRALVRSADGSWRVNRYRQTDAQVVIGRLERLLEDLAVLSEPMDRFVSLLGDSNLQRICATEAWRVATTSVLRDTVDRDPPDAFDSWVHECFRFEGARYSVRPTARVALRKLLDQVAPIADRLGRGPPVIRVDPKARNFVRERMQLFRSSSFYNPRTVAGVRIYRNEFENHHAARVFGLFEWNAHQSTDLASCIRRIRNTRPLIAPLVKTHDVLIVMINYVPTWMSRSEDDTVFDGHWQIRNAQPPHDYAVWKRLVRDTVAFMNQFKGVDVYYEIWNEPDGYWHDSLDAFLELYEQTALAIREAAPDAKIGGCGVNHWAGKMRGHADRDPITFELIRYAARRRLPLDFISWHQFTHPLSGIGQARAAYERELRAAGFAPLPQFVVSEWNFPLKGTRDAAASFADHMLAFYQAGVDIQTFAAWEEFNSDPPDPDGYGPYGLITAMGVKKPVFHVHELFDRLSRGSKGIDVLDPSDQGTSVVISNKGGGVYELLVWDLAHEPRLVAAIEYLKSNGAAQGDLNDYGSAARLEGAIRTAKPLKDAHRELFLAARDVYIGHDAPPRREQIEFTGAARIEVSGAQAVLFDIAEKNVHTVGPRLTCERDASEVLWLRVHVQQNDPSTPPTRQVPDQ